MQKVFCIPLLLGLLGLLGPGLGAGEMPRARRLAEAPLVEMSRLPEGVVRLQQRSEDRDFELRGRRIEDPKALFEQFRRSRQSLDEGLLVLFAWKTVGEDPWFAELANLCVERDVDLYRWTPSGEPGLETQVEWIVASSRSQAAEDE